jgi:hypothetical protein
MLFCLCWGLTAVIVVIAIAKHQLASLTAAARCRSPWPAGAWALAVLAAARHDIRVDANGALTTGQNALWWSALSEVFFLGTGSPGWPGSATRP